MGKVSTYFTEPNGPALIADSLCKKRERRFPECRRKPALGLDDVSADRNNHRRRWIIVCAPPNVEPSAPLIVAPTCRGLKPKKPLFVLKYVAVAVGIPIAQHPPHKTVRALQRIRLPPRILASKRCMG